MEMKGYYWSAENSRQYFEKAYNSGDVFNDMAAQAQNICERYLKDVIDCYADKNDSKKRKELLSIMRQHDIVSLLDYVCSLVDIKLSGDVYNKIVSVNNYYIRTRYPVEDFIVVTRDVLIKCHTAI